ncbi:MAG: glycosyltransferase [Akkermansiaceae bacterium]
MRIIILTIGTRGDVAPHVALGVGLKSIGHQVVIATYSAYQEMVEHDDLEFVTLPGNPRKLLKSHEGKHSQNTNTNPLAYLRQLRDQASLIRKKAHAFFDRCLEVSEPADLLIYTLTTPQGSSIAKYLGIPYIRTAGSPITPTRHFPSFISPTKRNLGGFLNLTSHSMLNMAMWLPFKSILDGWRKERLGLKPAGWRGPMREDDREGIPMFYWMSKTIVPRPPDWPDWVHVTGYWYAPEHSEWQAPNALEEFLESGPPPVYFGFGSMLDDDSEALLSTLLDVVKHTNIRALIQVGKDDITLLEKHSTKTENTPISLEKDTGETGNYSQPMTGNLQVESQQYLLINETPHEWLFPKTSVIIHHGGCGTTHNALRAGVPQIIVGYQGDQMYWGHRCFSVGTAVAPIPRRRLNSENLAKAISDILQNPHYTETAQHLAHKIQSEDAISATIYQINDYLESKNAAPLPPLLTKV